MPVVAVDLGERSYEIEVGTCVIATSDVLNRQVKGPSVLLVTNETVAPLYLDQVYRRLCEVAKTDVLVLPDGEKYKTLDTLDIIFSKLLENRHGRDTTLVALGGGVIGDMVGFAAATYQRGVSFIQIPTTLLSQVDSSVGGKTGVNHPLGKNMIGAFYQPLGVLIDTEVLMTLPEREFSAGMAEVIKYGLIYDAEFFTWLENNIEKIMQREPELLTYLIVRCCQIKAEVVAADERENNVRAILNFGHTYGHAIEVHQGYGNWLHGEAVGAGMMMACELSRDMGWLSQAEWARAKKIIQAAKLPIAPPNNMHGSDFIKYMALDKKVAAGKIKLVLLKSIGMAEVTAAFDQELLQRQLAQI